MKCNHPELFPTQWGQQKPEPCEMVGCCEKNQSCPVCGWGFGSYPCDCTNKVKVETEKEEGSHDNFFGYNIRRVIKTLKH